MTILRIGIIGLPFGPLSLPQPPKSTTAPPKQAEVPQQKPVTVYSVYGKAFANMIPPDGYQFTGEFRPGKKGEIVLGSCEPFYLVACPPLTGDADVPRLILRKIEEVEPTFNDYTVKSQYGVPMSQLSVPEGYELTGEFRPGKNGEVVLGTLDKSAVGMPGEGTYPRLILRRKGPVPPDDALVREQYRNKSFNEIAIPKGYELSVVDHRVEFRVPKAGDWFIANVGNGPILASSEWDNPRLIIVPKKAAEKPIPPRRFVFEETGENRIPKPGEWYLTVDGDKVLQTDCGVPRRIMRLTIG